MTGVFDTSTVAFFAIGGSRTRLELNFTMSSYGVVNNACIRSKKAWMGGNQPKAFAR